MRPSRNVVTQWIVTWGLLGVVTGIGLTFGDTGHLPVLWMIIIVLVGAMVAGLIAGLGFSWVNFILPTNHRRSPISRAIIGLITGAISAFLVGWFVLGVQWRYAIIWGAVAGVISVAVGLRLKTIIETKVER
jgi:MFS family permease